MNIQHHSTMVYNCNAVEYKSHSSKAKKLHIYPFMADAMWVKKRWKAPIWHERKDKTGENADGLEDVQAHVPIIPTRKRPSLTAAGVLILSTLPGVTGGSQ